MGDARHIKARSGVTHTHSAPRPHTHSHVRRRLAPFDARTEICPTFPLPPVCRITGTNALGIPSRPPSPSPPLVPLLSLIALHLAPPAPAPASRPCPHALGIPIRVGSPHSALHQCRALNAPTPPRSPQSHPARPRPRPRPRRIDHTFSDASNSVAARVLAPSIDRAAAHAPPLQVQQGDLVIGPCRSCHLQFVFSTREQEFFQVFVM